MCGSYDSDFFFFNDTATNEIYTLSLHDALPISDRSGFEGAEGGASTTANRWGRPYFLTVGHCGGSSRFETPDEPGWNTLPWIDRKSTRLNSSHANISYAVFCLKKKQHHNFITSP